MLECHKQHVEGAAALVCCEQRHVPRPLLRPAPAFRALAAALAPAALTLAAALATTAVTLTTALATTALTLTSTQNPVSFIFE